MTRSMGDAMGANAAALVAQNPDVFAIYVTGGGYIQWSAAQQAMIPAGKTVVTIDQGYIGSPVPWATVRDVESGAWSMAAAVNRSGWTAPRPTLYFSESLMVRRFLTTRERRDRVAVRLAGAYSAGWRGDVWVALYDDVPAVNFPVPAGINVVAKQYTDTAQGGNVDLSAVFDPTWPLITPVPDPPRQENDMLIIWGASGNAYLLSGGRMHHIADIGTLNLYVAAGVQQAGASGGAHVNAAEEAALLADFPAGNPAVTVNATLPPVKIADINLSLTGTAVPA